jgi:hypothetical protein
LKVSPCRQPLRSEPSEDGPAFLNKKAENGFIRKMKGPFRGWFQSKDLPAMAKKTFHERWKELEKS